MIGTISIVLAVLALAVSSLTAWLTLLRRGRILMTQPTIIYFGPDGGPPDDLRPTAKVFLRTLLYSTGKRGCLVENMFVTIHRGETRQSFNVWAYGDKGLLRGSGLFVPESGIATNHHFLPPSDGTNFSFVAGDYVLDVVVTEVGRKAKSLFSTTLHITPELADKVRQDDNGIYFDWGPDSRRYHSHVRPRPQ
jgi:hypothetical protein